MNDLPAINESLLFNGNILNFLNFFFHRYDIDFLLRDDLFIVLGDFFNSIKILFDYFARDSLYNFSLGIINNFSGFGHHLLDGSGFIVNDLLFIWNVFDSTGT